MEQIKYTEEMRVQDTLLENNLMNEFDESEVNPRTMMALHKSIIDDAKKLGSKLFTLTSFDGFEVITYLFNTEKQLEKFRSGQGAPDASITDCRTLIDTLLGQIGKTH